MTAEIISLSQYKKRRTQGADVSTWQWVVFGPPLVGLAIAFWGLLTMVSVNAVLCWWEGMWKKVKGR